MTVETLPISSDPSFEVTPVPQEVKAAEEASDYLKVGLLIGAGFLVWRKMVMDSVPSLAEPSAATVSEALERLAMQHGPTWLKLTMPGFKRAYQLGSHGALDDEELEYLAQVYATKVGEYIHETSAKAVLEGFNALVNQRWSPQIAYRRAFEGFGLTSEQMKSYITSMENLDKTYLPNSLTDDPRINATLTKMLSSRSISIGENEAYTAQEMARQIMWMQADQQGLLPAGIKRQWKTAKDELVCPTCAPMNNTTIDLYEKFEVEGQKYWAPILHPNCRCWVELIEPDVEEIGKAYDPMQTPRGGNPKNRGQFSRNWGPRTKTANPEVDRAVDELIANALKSQPKTFERKELKTFNDKAFKTFEVKDLQAAQLSEAAPAKSFKELRSKTMNAKTFTPKPGLSLRESMVIHYKAKPPLRVDQLKPTGEVHLMDGLYAFDYQPNDYQSGDVIEGWKISHPFVDRSDIAEEIANDKAEAIKGAVYMALGASDQLKSRFNDYLEDELTSQLSDMDEREIEQIAIAMGEDPVDVYDDRDMILNEIRSYLMEPELEQVPQSHHDNAQQILSDHPSLLGAHEDAVMQIVVDLLENHDPATTEAARHLIPEIFPKGLPYDEGATTIKAYIPTIYVVEDTTEAVLLDQADIDMGYARSKPYALDGEFEVSRTSYDENFTQFPLIQTVFLRRRDNLEKRFDPFGVVHLGVK